jgi:hypothetical protein
LATGAGLCHNLGGVGCQSLSLKGDKTKKAMFFNAL